MCHFGCFVVVFSCSNKNIPFRLTRGVSFRFDPWSLFVVRNCSCFLLCVINFYQRFLLYIQLIFFHLFFQLITQSPSATTFFHFAIHTIKHQKKIQDTQVPRCHSISNHYHTSTNWSWNIYYLGKLFKANAVPQNVVCNYR